jgi:hypothetical protein
MRAVVDVNCLLEFELFGNGSGEAVIKRMKDSWS